MSGAVLCGGSRLLLAQSAAGRQLLGALRVGRVRTFSATSPDEPYISVSPTDSGPRTVWPDENMGPFGPQDQRFQLPGNVGFDCHLEGMEEQRRKGPVHRTVPDVLTAPSSTERYQFVLAQFVNEFHGKLGPIDTRVQKAEQYFSQSDTRCSINSCPELLKKDLEQLFPMAPSSSITVVTVTQRRMDQVDQDKDQVDQDQDQDQLHHRFVNGAKEMCFALWTAGYWADFIDPSTGAAFFASPPGQSAPRRDEPAPAPGFHIEVSALCTVIRHAARGSGAPAFVGSVFTNAPTSSAAVTRLQGLAPELDDEGK